MLTREGKSLLVVITCPWTFASSLLIRFRLESPYVSLLALLSAPSLVKALTMQVCRLAEPSPGWNPPATHPGSHLSSLRCHPQPRPPGWPCCFQSFPAPSSLCPHFSHTALHVWSYKMQDRPSTSLLKILAAHSSVQCCPLVLNAFILSWCDSSFKNDHFS